MMNDWRIWALGSALFAALTAILAKVGVTGVPSNLATAIRTGVILCFACALIAATGEWRGARHADGRTWLFLVLSGLATGCSWLCYFRALQLGDAAQVAPIDKLSVVLVMAMGALLLGEKLTWHEWLGGALIACGAMVIVWKPT